MATHTRISPDARRKSITDFMTKLRSTPEIKRELQKWGLRFDPDLLTVRVSSFIIPARNSDLYGSMAPKRYKHTNTVLKSIPPPPPPIPMAGARSARGKDHHANGASGSQAPRRRVVPRDERKAAAHFFSSHRMGRRLLQKRRSAHQEPGRSPAESLPANGHDGE